MENKSMENKSQNASSPPAKRSSLKKWLKVAGITVLAIISIGQITVVIFVVSLLATFEWEMQPCVQGGSQLFSQTSTTTKEFNAIKFVPTQTKVKAKVTKQTGDCIDSIPTIHETRDFTVTSSAGATFDHIAKVLTENGYTPKKDKYYPRSNQCSYRDDISPYYYTYTRGDRNKIDITLTCARHPIGNEAWRQIPATHVTASLEVEAPHSR